MTCNHVSWAFIGQLVFYSNITDESHEHLHLRLQHTKRLELMNTKISGQNFKRPPLKKKTDKKQTETSWHILP